MALGLLKKATEISTTQSVEAKMASNIVEISAKNVKYVRRTNI